MRYELAVRVAEENQVRPPQDQLRLPSRATLARRIAAANSGSRSRHGLTGELPNAATTQYGQTPYPDLPLERVEIDHTRSDLVVIDDRDNLPLGRLDADVLPGYWPRAIRWAITWASSRPVT